MSRNDRTQALATAALAKMAERNIEPTPANFELFFTFAAGENPAVTRVVGDLLKAGAEMTPAILDDLRKRLFTEDRLEGALDAAGSELANAVNKVSARLETAEREAVAYGRTLSDASGELGGSQSPDELRKLVAGLKAATQEMEDRTKNLEADLQRSSQQVSELKSKLDDVRKESLTDGLTGIANRKAFDAALDRAVEAARESGEPLSLFMCDIDHFKQFNDRWGHQTGDQVLRLVSQCLSDNVKGRDTAARYGGEEFAVILPQTAVAYGAVLANQIRASVETRKLVKKSTGDILGRITISIGATQLEAGDTPASLIKRADKFLYVAKRTGRNKVVYQADASTLAEVDAA